MDVAARDLWVPGLEVPQVHPGLFPFVLDYSNAQPQRGYAEAAQWLLVASGYQERQIRSLLEFNDGVAGHPVPIRLRIYPHADQDDLKDRIRSDFLLLSGSSNRLR